VRFWVRRPGLEGLPKSVHHILCNTSSCTTHPHAPPAVVAGRGLSPWHEAGMAAPRMLAADKISAASIVAMKCRHEGETRSVIQLPYKFHDGSGERGPGFRVPLSGFKESKHRRAEGRQSCGFFSPLPSPRQHVSRSLQVKHRPVSLCTEALADTATRRLWMTVRS